MLGKRANAVLQFNNVSSFYRLSVIYYIVN
jgi:hypothetical protein